MQNKKRVAFLIILVLLVVALIAATSLAGQGKPASSLLSASKEKNGSAKQGQEALTGLEGAVSRNPDDVTARLKLADAYFNLGMEEKNTIPDQAAQHFRQAAAAYQEAAKRRDSVQVTVNLAIAAFYGKDNDLAEQVFKAAADKYPDAYEVHYNYGIFLYHVKQDYPASIQEWHRALVLKPTGPEADQLQKLITGLQGQIKESQVKQP